MKKIAQLLSFILLASCSKTIVDKPKNLIEENKMVDILYDLALLDAVRTQIPKEKQHYKGFPNQYIFKKHQIDSLQFVKSNQYYASDISNYKKIFERVKEKLEQDKKNIFPKLSKENQIPEELE